MVIRKNADDLSDWVDRAVQLYSGLGAKIAYRPAEITFPSGAKIKTGHLKDDQAYTKYQGHEYQRMVIEEATQIPDEKRYMQLISSCRSTVSGIKPQIFLTANPGGVGHGWVKRRFIEKQKAMKPFIAGGRKRIFIPATIDDNPTLIDSDPSYVKTLDSLKDTDEQLWKAWRLGDWDVFMGQFFREWRHHIHVVHNLDYPLEQCDKIIGFDWGYNAPGSATWLAYAPEDQMGVSRVYAYREIYQNGRNPEEWANDIKTFTDKEEVDYIVLPHDCYSKPHGIKLSIADTFKKIIRIPIREGRTLDKGSRKNRAAITHQYLGMAKDGKPYLQVTENCVNLIRTLPELVHDEANVEVVDKKGEDHAYDSLSLGLMSKYAGISESGIIKHKSAIPNKSLINTMGDGKYKSQDFWEEIKNKKKKGKGWEYS